MDQEFDLAQDWSIGQVLLVDQFPSTSYYVIYQEYSHQLPAEKNIRRSVTLTAAAEERQDAEEEKGNACMIDIPH